ncbi:MAG: DUF2461 domain-containing protein [Nitrospinae bacterium]|nr:DUF2461 domain-containing protein [Nitrospinota bacterium]
MKNNGASFKGFPPVAFTFLAGLARHNEKPWFEAQREVYEQSIAAPALLFAAELAVALRRVAPGVAAEPRVGGSVFRIHRDTRFSRDKSPYKTHVGIRLRDPASAGSSGCAGPVFYVEFDAKRLRLGVGVKDFEAGALAAFREAVAVGRADDIEAMMKKAASLGHEIIGETLAKPPRGYSADRISPLLLRKGLFAREEKPLPEQIHKPEFVRYCARWFTPYAPLFNALRRITTRAP